MKKTALVAVALLLSGAASPAAERAPGGRDGAKRIRGKVVPRAARPSSRTPQLFDTITYDTGVNAGFHPDSLFDPNRTVGNRFNSLLGGPLLMTNMVWAMTVFPAIAGSQSVSIADTPTMGSAKVLYWVNVSLQANQFNVIELDRSVWVRADFLGIFLGQFNAYQGDLLGMSDMSTMGQGYHAFQAFYADGFQTMIEVVPNRNAMLRVTVDALVPVELMDFRIQ